jgi:hypothetical protein
MAQFMVETDKGRFNVRADSHRDALVLACGNENSPAVEAEVGGGEMFYQFPDGEEVSVKKAA